MGIEGATVVHELAVPGPQLNAHFASTAHQPLPMSTRMNTIVISCLDARVDPAHFLGLEPGEVMVMRNAGGRATDEVQQQIGMLLALARKIMGPDASLDIVLVHHTDCGMEHLANPKLRAGISAGTSIPLATLDSWAIGEHSESLRTDLQRLRDSPWVPAGTSITGAIYEQKTGTLTSQFTEVV